MAALGGEISKIAERYAGALFDLARESNQLDAVERDLSRLEAALAQSADLRRLVHHPVFKPADQLSGMNEVLKNLKIEGLVRNFLHVLINKRRLFAIDRIITSYHALASRERGEIKAGIVSATPLSPEQRESLADALRQKLGKSPKMVVSVDPRLLGGLVVKVGSQMFDTSLRTRLKHLEIAMKEAR